jgi:RNA polymerase sigma factor (sigma-70 family)
MPQALELRPATALLAEPRLLADARHGDDRAFEELYSRYRQRIFAFIVSRVHDHGRAEDIAQEVFMSALRQLRASDQEIVLQPWLYAIAKNACIDEFRRGARGAAVPVGSDDDLSVGRGPMLSAVPTPDDAIESTQRLDDLRGAFGGLSDTHRQMLVMREFEGRSYDEIGERLGMNRQMVESGLFRARRKLGSEYDDLASGRRCEQMVEAIGAGMFETAKALGLKERRRVTRHLSHCQSCRHHAMMASVDQTLLKPRSIADKLAALLPFGIWRKFWPHGHGGAGAAAGGAKTALGGAAQVAAPAAAGSSISMGTAAVTAAVVAIAGAGGGLALTQLHSTHAAPSHAAAHARVSHAPVGTVSGAGHGSTDGAARSGAAAYQSARASVRRGGHSAGATVKPHGAKLTGAGASSGAATSTNRGNGGRSGGGNGGKSTGGSGGSSGGGGGSTGGSGGGSTGNGGGTGSSSSSSGGNDAGNDAGKTVSKTAGNTVNQTGGTVSGVVSGTGSTVGNTVSGVTGTVGGVVSGTGSTVGNTVSGVTGTVGGTVSQTGNTVGGIVNTVAPGVGSTVSGVTNTVGGVVSGTGSTVGNTVSGVTGTVGSTVSQTGATVGNTVNGVTGVVGGVLGGH